MAVSVFFTSKLDKPKFRPEPPNTGPDPEPPAVDKLREVVGVEVGTVWTEERIV